MLTLLLVACRVDSSLAPRAEAPSAGCAPSAEVCNGEDDDCDGLVDDADPDRSDAPTWHADADGDGYGDAATDDLACEPPTGWTADATDCDDADAAVSPGAAEVCNDADDDCDSLVDGRDEDLADGVAWYADADGDGHGDPLGVEVSCNRPPGYAETGDDCDDADAARSPDATEVCNDADDDCDGEVDEDATGGATWYRDADGDGYGDATVSTTACEPGSGWVANGRDCDDDDPSTGACTGVDDGAICASLWGLDDAQVPSWFGGCDPSLGFSSYNGHCYYAVDSGSSWVDARASCAAAGGYLAVATDLSESGFVYGLTGRVWAGGCDGDVEGTWTWVTGEAWSWTDFPGGEPNDTYGTEECLEITGASGAWNDIWCTYNSFGQGYVCEFE